jgi:hypothetical protein
MSKPSPEQLPESFDSREAVRAKLNLETAPLAWSELQRHFALGIVYAVDARLDLIDVAERIASDDRQAVSQWMKDGGIYRVSDQQARLWLDAGAALWTVVVKPWVLVQEKRAVA